MTPYETLGIPPESLRRDIRAAYLKLAKENHPDVGGDPARFQAIQEAWDILGDDDRRAKYDATGEAGNGASDRAKVDNILCTFFAQAILNADIEKADLVGMMVGFIQVEILQHTDEMRKIGFARDRMRKIRKRLKFKGEGRDAIEDAFEAVELEHAKQEAPHKERLALLKQAKERAAFYKYDLGDVASAFGRLIDSTNLQIPNWMK